MFVHGTSPLAPRDSVFGIDVVRRDATTFEVMPGCEVGARYLRDSLGAERVMAVRGERDFFKVLGIAPLHGRTWDETDPEDVAVVSEGFWRRRLGGDPAAIGSVLRLDGQSFTIVGIMPAWFQLPYGCGSIAEDNLISVIRLARRPNGCLGALPPP